MLTPTPAGLLLPLQLDTSPRVGHPLAPVHARLVAGEEGYSTGPRGTLVETGALRA